MMDEWDSKKRSHEKKLASALISSDRVDHAAQITLICRG
jgi:hypothetical protein